MKLKNASLNLEELQRIFYVLKASPRVLDKSRDLKDFKSIIKNLYQVGMSLQGYYVSLDKSWKIWN